MARKSIDALISKYIRAWNEPDPAARNRLLEVVWAPQGIYADPISHATDRAGLDALIARFHRDNPGAKFSTKGKVDHHHGHVRFNWVLHLANGLETQGMDYGEISPDGTLAKIVGFFDETT